MIALGEKRVRNLIKTIGLYRTKAKNVIALSRKLLAEHGGQVPRSREALEALPGVGRKTANVVLNIAFGELTIAVDTHIFRVGNRTGNCHRQDAIRGRDETKRWYPPNTSLMRTIGLFCTGVTLVSRAGRCARNASSATFANGREKQSGNVFGRRAWKAAVAAATLVDHADPKVWFERAQLPVKSAVAWHKSGFRTSGNSNATSPRAEDTARGC